MTGLLFCLYFPVNVLINGLVRKKSHLAEHFKMKFIEHYIYKIPSLLGASQQSSTLVSGRFTWDIASEWRISNTLYSQH